VNAEPILVHDYLLVMRGAERSFAAMAAQWPEAPIATLLYDREATSPYFDGHEISTSWMQRLGVRQKGFRALLPLFPRAAERLPVGGHQLVVSSSSAFAHGVRPDPGAVHVCYCYSPFRYAWHERERALQEVPRAARPLLNAILDRIRAWDRAAAQRVSAYISISEITRTRIQDFWGRDSTVVHPPVEVERFSIGTPEDYFLFVGEIVSHKQIELALKAARKAGVPMKVVGEGPDAERLKSEYADTAEFVGRVDDPQLVGLMASARALIVPNVEEFGIAAVEAQAAGRPVLAAAAGGVLETVIDGETGILLPPGDGDALAEALANVNFDSFDPARIAAHAQQFSVSAFQRRLAAEVSRIASAGS
jgi:glycosyltransferase involved in cell wall biosynthesis